MKKFYLTLIFISAIGLSIFIGCSKEKNQIVENQENSLQPTKKDLQIEKRILAFKQRIKSAKENPNLKSSGDNLTPDETVWYTESLLNYTYADAANDKEYFIIDSIFIDVALTNEKVSFNNVVSFYDQIVDSLTKQYNLITYTEKHLVFVDVFNKVTSGQSCTFGVIFGFNAGPPINPFAGFGDNDWWFYGNSDYNQGGYCNGPYSGTHKDSDAAEEIEKKIRYRQAIPGGGQYYYTDIVTVLIISPTQDVEIGSNTYPCNLINPNDTNPDDNYYDYLMFVSNTSLPNYHLCLCPDEMNFYLNGMEYIIYTKLYSCIPEINGKDFISCNMGYDFILCSNFVTINIHTACINYGILHFNPISPGEL